ncbi:MAG: energy transducer TonB [Alcaligenaceae bacterium]|nr:energy transducer TonB [Alcaligenaceae bacterium SAGV5]MPS55291.1 energy transducer TonB [Alcaligenaceae bacterium SAGV3]MPT57216.1 energy transducer TonB [Alcaligenaceae bacterium]
MKTIKKDYWMQSRLIVETILAGTLFLAVVTDALALGGADLVSIQGPQVSYPKEARRKQQQGRVILYAEISPDGIPYLIKILESSGFPLLDSAAVEGFKTARYEPFESAGAVGVYVPIDFALSPRPPGQQSTLHFLLRSCREFNLEAKDYQAANPDTSMQSMSGYQETLEQMQAFIEYEPLPWAPSAMKSREERHREYAEAFPHIFASALDRCTEYPSSNAMRVVHAASREMGFFRQDRDDDLFLFRGQARGRLPRGE